MRRLEGKKMRGSEGEKVRKSEGGIDKNSEVGPAVVRWGGTMARQACGMRKWEF